jgi:hypothetical protein
MNEVGFKVPDEAVQCTGQATDIRTVGFEQLDLDPTVAGDSNQRLVVFTLGKQQDVVPALAKCTRQVDRVDLHAADGKSLEPDKNAQMSWRLGSAVQSQSPSRHALVVGWSSGTPGGRRTVSYSFSKRPETPSQE